LSNSDDSFGPDDDNPNDHGLNDNIVLPPTGRQWHDDDSVPGLVTHTQDNDSDDDSDSKDDNSDDDDEDSDYTNDDKDRNDEAKVADQVAD
jgi:hypothetical protein